MPNKNLPKPALYPRPTRAACSPHSLTRDRCAASIRKVCAECAGIEFILQCNAQTRSLWERVCGEAAGAAAPPPNLALLYDESMGLGLPCSTWRAPHAGVACGYAGGLSPENIKEQLCSIGAAAAGRSLWVDMESSLRTKTADGKDVFDVNKAVACVRAVREMGLL